MKYLFKLVLRLLFVIAVLVYLCSGLVLIVPIIIYILGLNEEPIGCTIDFFDDMYWKINIGNKKSEEQSKRE